MHRIVAAIAANTVRELVRSKLLYNLLLFAALFLIGHLISDLQAFAARSKSATLASIARGFYMLLPDLEMLNLKSHAANELAVGGAFVWRAAAYGLCYAAVVLVLAILIFSRRDLN